MNKCEENTLRNAIESANASLDEYRMIMSWVLNAYVEEAKLMWRKNDES
jgi:hypothetical protein